ncbi:hypothetical protein HPB47_015877 [Ixodes persulcatus]|uniref:Uncharacterized protein n=1 Tax=Ixodes persulcatus TaxID=34615 RepID=A0AC60QS92_IXOPE|nr:hypothetical protein HPB47_015877 [Ixodes persulcatus]
MAANDTIFGWTFQGPMFLHSSLSGSANTIVCVLITSLRTHDDNERGPEWLPAEPGDWPKCRALCDSFPAMQAERRQEHHVLHTARETTPELLNLSSHNEMLRKEIETIKQDLRKYDYTARFVNSTIKKLRRTPSTQDDAPPSARVNEELPERLRRHRYDIVKKNVEVCALVEHVEKTNHSIDLDNSSILGMEKNWCRRFLLLSWHIQCTRGNVNRSTGTLPSSYVSGLREIIRRAPGGVRVRGQARPAQMNTGTGTSLFTKKRRLGSCGEREELKWFTWAQKIMCSRAWCVCPAGLLYAAPCNSSTP